MYTATEKAYPELAGNLLSHYDWNLKPGSPLARSTFNPEGGGCVMLAMLQEAGDLCNSINGNAWSVGAIARTEGLKTANVKGVPVTLRFLAARMSGIEDTKDGRVL